MKNNILILALLTLTFSIMQKSISQSSNCISECISPNSALTFEESSIQNQIAIDFNAKQIACTPYTTVCAGKILW